MDHVGLFWIILDHIGSDWIRLDPIGSDCMGLDTIGSDWIWLNPIGSDSIRLDHIRSDSIKLDQMISGWLEDDLGISRSTLDTLAACLFKSGNIRLLSHIIVFSCTIYSFFTLIWQVIESKDEEGRWWLKVFTGFPSFFTVSWTIYLHNWRWSTLLSSYQTFFCLLC